MAETPDLWEVLTLPGGLSFELQAGGNPVLLLAQGERRVVVDLPHVKHVVEALTDTAADLAELLTAGDVYHA